MDGTGMSDLASKAMSAQVRLSMGEYAAAKTSVEPDDNEILHTMSTAKDVLSKTCHMTVVTNSHSQSQIVT